MPFPLFPCVESGSGPLQTTGFTPQANRMARYSRYRDESESSNKPEVSGGGELRLRHVCKVTERQAMADRSVSTCPFQMGMNTHRDVSVLRRNRVTKTIAMDKH